MKMKIIDLLNKIANGEEVPKKIIINGCIYEYQGDDYLFIDKNNDNHEYWLFSVGYTNKFQWLDVFLKTEVEIIEEDKKIEKLIMWTDTHSWLDDNDIDKALQEQSQYNKIIYYKINEIIDKLNKE